MFILLPDCLDGYWFLFRCSESGDLLIFRRNCSVCRRRIILNKRNLKKYSKALWVCLLFAFVTILRLLALLLNWTRRRRNHFAVSWRRRNLSRRSIDRTVRERELIRKKSIIEANCSNQKTALNYKNSEFTCCWIYISCDLLENWI